eukprot:jgi/Mesvir1/16187/Mv08452-RA.1
MGNPEDKNAIKHWFRRQSLQIVLDGYLRKRKSSGPSLTKTPGHWNRRWFILSESTLSYAHAPTDKKPGAVFALADLTDVRHGGSSSKGDGFDIIIELLGRSMRLRADNEYDQRKWVKEIKGALDRLVARREGKATPSKPLKSALKRSGSVPEGSPRSRPSGRRSPSFPPALTISPATGDEPGAATSSGDRPSNMVAYESPFDIMSPSAVKRPLPSGIESTPPSGTGDVHEESLAATRHSGTTLLTRRGSFDPSKDKALLGAAASFAAGGKGDGLGGAASTGNHTGPNGVDAGHYDEGEDATEVVAEGVGAHAARMSRGFGDRTLASADNEVAWSPLAEARPQHLGGGGGGGASAGGGGAEPGSSSKSAADTPGSAEKPRKGGLMGGLMKRMGLKKSSASSQGGAAASPGSDTALTEGQKLLGTAVGPAAASPSEPTPGEKGQGADSRSSVTGAADAPGGWGSPFAKRALMQDKPVMDTSGSSNPLPSPDSGSLGTSRRLGGAGRTSLAPDGSESSVAAVEVGRLARKLSNSDMRGGVGSGSGARGGLWGVDKGAEPDTYAGLGSAGLSSGSGAGWQKHQVERDAAIDELLGDFETSKAAVPAKETPGDKVGYKPANGGVGKVEEAGGVGTPKKPLAWEQEDVGVSKQENNIGGEDVRTSGGHKGGQTAKQAEKATKKKPVSSSSLESKEAQELRRTSINSWDEDGDDGDERAAATRDGGELGDVLEGSGDEEGDALRSGHAKGTVAARRGHEGAGDGEVPRRMGAGGGVDDLEVDDLDEDEEEGREREVHGQGRGLPKSKPADDSGRSAKNVPLPSAKEPRSNAPASAWSVTERAQDSDGDDNNNNNDGDDDDGGCGQAKGGKTNGGGNAGGADRDGDSSSNWDSSSSSSVSSAQSPSPKPSGRHKAPYDVPDDKVNSSRSSRAHSSKSRREEGDHGASGRHGDHRSSSGKAPGATMAAWATSDDSKPPVPLREKLRSSSTSKLSNDDAHGAAPARRRVSELAVSDQRGKPLTSSSPAAKDGREKDGRGKGGRGGADAAASSSGRDRGERSERRDKGAREERPDRVERGDRGDKSERSDSRGERGDRSERSDRGERAHTSVSSGRKNADKYEGSIDGHADRNDNHSSVSEHGDRGGRGSSRHHASSHAADGRPLARAPDKRSEGGKERSEGDKSRSERSERRGDKDRDEGAAMERRSSQTSSDRPRSSTRHRTES